MNKFRGNEKDKEREKMEKYAQHSGVYGKNEEKKMFDSSEFKPKPSWIYDEDGKNQSNLDFSRLCNASQ